jgi:hypothetical protein
MTMSGIYGKEVYACLNEHFSTRLSFLPYTYCGSYSESPQRVLASMRIGSAS